MPLAWLIGEATEHAAEHTGPGIGGFLNASFGNAPELIVALFAVGANLPDVVRGSLSGSVISNLLLVYGATQIAGPDGARIDRRSLLVQIGLVGAAVVAFVLPAALGYTGDPERHAVVVASVPVAIALLLLYLYVVGRNLRRHREHEREREEPGEGTWSLATALAAPAGPPGAPAWGREILVLWLAPSAGGAGGGGFFTAFVIVVTAGTAAEDGDPSSIACFVNDRSATEI